MQLTQHQDVSSCFYRWDLSILDRYVCVRAYILHTDVYQNNIKEHRSTNHVRDEHNEDENEDEENEDEEENEEDEDNDENEDEDEHNE